MYGNSKSARPRKKNGNEFPSNAESQAEIQARVDSLQLRSWKLPTEASLFIRAPKNSDHSIYAEVKKNTEDEVLPLEDPQALITYSVYNKLPWRPSFVSRSSQHCILSSQTLGDLFEAIPCPSNELPAEKHEDSRVIGYDTNKRMEGSHGTVICINGLAYGDGMSETDYASKLLQHVQTFKSSVELKRAPTTMDDTLLQTLSLTISEPYWLLHEGNCEHYVVIDSISTGLIPPQDIPSCCAENLPFWRHVQPALKHQLFGLSLEMRDWEKVHVFSANGAGQRWANPSKVVLLLYLYSSMNLDGDYLEIGKDGNFAGNIWCYFILFNARLAQSDRASDF
ncbi:hypothetical protein PQX77_018483 [Marasmius sp. AFHP31]|nr:hypothetical protein PQX77_018483 [Marasmius sp. AFHP31]